MSGRNSFAILSNRMRHITPCETESIFTEACQALESSIRHDTTEENVNDGVLLIMQTSCLDGLPLNNVLHLWKIYLLFLKKNQDQINSHLSEKLVSTISSLVFQGLEVNFLVKIHQLTDSTTAAKKLQLLLFFCQRLFTTIVYLSSTLCDDTIGQSFHLMLLCRGLNFSLGDVFKDQLSITSKLSKFDSLFASCLEAQPSQSQRFSELGRRRRLYHEAVKSAYTRPCEGVRHKFILLGVLSYTCSKMTEIGQFLRKKDGDTEAVAEISQKEMNGTGQEERIVLQYVQEVSGAVRCLNCFFCGQVKDQILTSLVEEFGEKVAQIILHPLSTVQGGKTVSHLVAQCLGPVTIRESVTLSTDVSKSPGSDSGRLSGQVEMAWARLLLVAVVFNREARGRREGGHLMNMSPPVTTSSSASLPMLLPCVVLEAIQALLVKAEESLSCAQAILTPPFGLLCRVVIIASVSSCTSGGYGYGYGSGDMQRISGATVNLKNKLLRLSNIYSGRGVYALAAEEVLELALPFPDVLSFSEECGGLVVNKKNALDSMISLLGGACERTSCSNGLSLSIWNILNIISQHVPAVSILNEASPAPTPFLPSHHVVALLTEQLLLKTKTLLRYSSNICKKMCISFSVQVPSFPNEQSKKRSVDCDQAGASGGKEGCHLGWESCGVARARPALNGLLLLTSSLQHVLPAVYTPGTEGMSSQITSLVDGAVDMAGHLYALARLSGSEFSESMLALRYQLLRVCCSLLTASSLCNGLMNEELFFNKCREAFLLLFESLGMTATHKPDTTKREELESSDSEAQHFSHLSLTTALMWTTLLQCVLDFGERARVNPKIRSRVPTLVPAKMLHLVQARAGRSTTPLSQPGRPVEGNASRAVLNKEWMVVTQLSGMV